MFTGTEDGSIWRTAGRGRDTCTGRLPRRNPDASIEVALEGLAFANGLAQCPGGVAATTAARRTRAGLRR